jgi:hypothetical protein
MSTIIIPESNNKPKALIEPGTYPARCVGMVHIGTLTQEYEGQEKHINKVRLTFEMPTELHVFSDEKGPQPFVVSKKFTLSFHEKGKLRPFLESWRGKKFTGEEIKNFDITKLLGAPCTLTLSEGETAKGVKYTDITGIGKVMKGMVVPDMISKPLIFGYTPFNLNVFNSLPEFLQEEIKTTPEYMAVINEEFLEQNQGVEAQEEEEELPF